MICAGTTRMRLFLCVDWREVKEKLQGEGLVAARTDGQVQFPIMKGLKIPELGWEKNTGIYSDQF